jgi:prevent-host-death family protein
MPRAVSTREARDTLSSIIGWVRENADEVIVESHGQPTAVIMSFTEYERIQAVREQQRRQEALEGLRRLRDEVSARNRDLTEAQADALADRFTREVIDDMAAEGRIRFERDT